MLVGASFLCGDYKAKAVQPTNAKHLEVGHGRNAKRNRAAFLKSVVRGATSLLVGASFLCGDYKAKAVQPTNAKHLAVEHGQKAIYVIIDCTVGDSKKAYILTKKI